jgi:hypothetical protein
VPRPPCLCASAPFFMDLLPNGTEVVHIGVCTSVHVANRQIRVKIGQNGVKIGSKNDQKRAQIVMPILTFWVRTPSGASARAVLGVPKGQKPVFRGSKMPCGKVIHKMWKTLTPPGARERPTARGPAAAPNRSPAPSCQASVSGEGLSNRKERKERKEKTGEKRLAAPEAPCSTRLTFAFFVLFAVRNACRPARPASSLPASCVPRGAGTPGLLRAENTLP